MRAISQNEFGGPEVLREVDVPRPKPLPTEVLVRVVSAGLNPVDTKTRAGGGMAGVLGEPPFILGWDVSGVVEEVGFGVHTLKVGDEVYGMPWFPRQAGGFAEYVTAPSRQFVHKPSTVDHDSAAAVPLAALTGVAGPARRRTHPARTARARARGCRRRRAFRRAVRESRRRHSDRDRAGGEARVAPQDRRGRAGGLHENPVRAGGPRRRRGRGPGR